MPSHQFQENLPLQPCNDEMFRTKETVSTSHSNSLGICVIIVLGSPRDSTSFRSGAKSVGWKIRLANSYVHEASHRSPGCGRRECNGVPNMQATRQTRDHAGDYTGLCHPEVSLVVLGATNDSSMRPSACS